MVTLPHSACAIEVPHDARVSVAPHDALASPRHDSLFASDDARFLVSPHLLRQKREFYSIHQLVPSLLRPTHRDDENVVTSPLALSPAEHVGHSTEVRQSSPLPSVTRPALFSSKMTPFQLFSPDNVKALGATDVTTRTGRHGSRR